MDLVSCKTTISGVEPFTMLTLMQVYQRRELIFCVFYFLYERCDRGGIRVPDCGFEGDIVLVSFNSLFLTSFLLVLDSVLENGVELK